MRKLILSLLMFCALQVSALQASAQASALPGSAPLASPSQASAQVWHDAAQMHVFGKAVEATYAPFVRFPEDINAQARKALKNLGQDAAGLYLQFRTDSPTVHVRWTSVKQLTMSHMASVGSRGLDLYVRTAKDWRFVGSARPDLKKAETTRVLVKELDPGMKTFRIYLSLYDGISALEIGVEEGSSFEPEGFEPTGAALESEGPAFEPKPSAEMWKTRKAPVVMYGTSILQGGCVSRPGMAATNILGRWLDREVVNLGFSGNALLDAEIAELMARVENPAVFVLDNVPNDTPEMILERMEPFVKTLREAHPDVPIVFVEQAPYAHDFVSASSAGRVRRKNEAQYTMYKRLKAAGYKKLYYVSGEKLIGTDGEATVDYVHQTDLGAMRYAEALYPILKRPCK
ncbi:MAG: SGNH/GDSL hydrolase family protein [Bacteroidales bacterium]|nr:SGNH/GDSL hydrolase family protein [Bacteroidales bacterium]